MYQLETVVRRVTALSLGQRRTGIELRGELEFPLRAPKLDSAGRYRVRRASDSSDCDSGDNKKLAERPERRYSVGDGTYFFRV